MSEHVTAFAPGRANLIGEHTDYNGGLALPFAISEGVTVVADGLAEARIEAFAEDFGESDTFALDDVAPADRWRAFVRGAVGELAAFGVPLGGARLRISGNVPQGGGLSSSAALEVALTLALLAIADTPEPDRITLAQLCSRIENEWVGAQTGLLDQLSSLCGEPEHALKIDFQVLSVEPVPLALGAYTLVTLDSGEQHANAASGYNERRAECAEAAQRLSIPTLRDASLADIETLPSPLRERARHVLTENERVEATVDALAHGDLERVGGLLDASHRSLRDDYAISTPAVEAAVKRLKDAGAIGARIVGGGFGGNVLGLLAPDASPPPDAIVVRPGPGARLLAKA